MPRRLLQVMWVLLALPLATQAIEPIRVVIYDHHARGTGPAGLTKILNEEAGFSPRWATAEQIRTGALHDAEVVIFPGGSGSGQAARLEESGRDEVRRFVRQGGGYLGICAGAYLASSQYDWSLHLLNARVIDRKHWARGKGLVKLSLSKAGRELLATPLDEVEVIYAQGPLLAPAIEADLPPYTPLALYETGIAKKEAPEGIMPGTTAIAKGNFGEGRVLCFSPHPEKEAGPHGFIEAGVRWASGRVMTSKEQKPEPVSPVTP